jgi:hypothetical protein
MLGRSTDSLYNIFNANSNADVIAYCVTIQQNIFKASLITAN